MTVYTRPALFRPPPQKKKHRRGEGVKWTCKPINSFSIFVSYFNADLSPFFRMISSQMFRTLHLIISPFLYSCLSASLLLPQSTRAHFGYRLLNIAVTPRGPQCTKTVNTHSTWNPFRNSRLIFHISTQSSRMSYWH